MISYFDCAATTKPTEQVINDINEALKNDWYNPSAVSEESRQVKLKIEHARQQVTDYINCEPEEIIFTSGGTESNNLAIKGFYTNEDIRPYGLFCSTIDHPSIFNVIQSYKNKGFLAKAIPVDKNGQINLEKLEQYLRISQQAYVSSYHDIIWHPLVCISYVNNEIGAINNINTISKLVHEYNGFLFVDAVQAIECKPIDVKGMGIDMLSASFHKFGGVRGCGFLYVNKNIKLNPQIIGGHQENNLRAGTEASYLIEAMGNRLQYLKEHKNDRLKKLADINFEIMGGLITGLGHQNNIKINGEHCAPHIISLTIPNISAQELIPLMNIDGVIVSAGSACSSGESIPSRVLKGIGLTDEEALSTIRISFNEFTTEEDVGALIKSLIKNVDILRQLHSEDEE